MSNTAVDEHCKSIQKHAANISIEQLKTSFDVFTVGFKEIDIPDTKSALIEKILVTLANLPHRNKILLNSELVKHEFFIILRDNAIIHELHRKQTEESVTQKFVLDATILFMNLSYNIDDSNVDELKSLLFSKPLIDELVYCLQEIGTNGKYLNDSQLLRSVRSLLTIFKNIINNHMTAYDYSLIAPIFSAVTQCLCSPYAIGMIKSLDQHFYQKLDNSQTLFLHTMPRYLQWYPDYGDPENLIKILRTLLHEFTAWTTSCQPDSYLQCSSQVNAMIRQLTYFLIRPVESENINIFSEEFYSDYCKLVLQWSSFLSSALKHHSNKANLKSKAQTIVQVLYNFTLHLNVLNFMKTIPDLISMLLKLTETDHDEIQLNAYRCLGKIMVENNIKAMANPGKIATVYIDFIRNTIDDPGKTERFDSLLKSLKNFVQHDQVKTELIKQGILPLLMKCVVEVRFDPIKVRQVALEILLALSFFNEACLILKQNEDFMNHSRSLAENANSDHAGLQRAAEGLLWKLEKENEAVAKPSILYSHKYNIMISYAHKNQELCLQIHQELVKHGFNVWLDRECLHGSTMIGIANAIENSENVLICMSNAYKESVYCQSEAHYAFERGCRLIPIIVEADYKPDGWLGIIVSGKIYVNFANTEFDLAYEKLKNEIIQQHQTDSNPLPTNSTENDSMSLEHAELLSNTIEDLPYSITEWTHDHVKLFLLRMELGATILPLCTRLDGDRLLQLYEMCLSNRESMYQSLKFELNERYHTLLPIADYLTFLHEIKVYIPSNTIKSPSSFFRLTMCDLM
ncbi:unnamed protein product [Rotaria magnacalcarata]|uniref:TIR domain-containing protein n=3 Tax=Rotaria magnacalcarata TaxID=392030 RepID=A0A818X4R6_9BILA|nr:unnamed protein product [Rotaria magnacalcarata]CAF2117725.1 unnamed protein product [Rotaria magnacalcarata]CAF3732210.1 unnamed protein product [Rotaria magnacalcarata]CAF3846546.1 unnamed protein product [Rotaria magnacalcarata]